MPDLRIVSDDDRLAEIVRLFDSGPDLIPVRDIGWLIDVARERDALRAEVEKLKKQHEYDRNMIGVYEADGERLRVALEEIMDLDLEGDASLPDAMGIADEALNPSPAPFTQDEVDAAVKALDTLPWQS